jgi:DeoR family glycerol-3-phosphate regulon repressor
MYKHERLQQLRDLLSSNEFLTTKALAAELSVSQTTIYRYLKELEDSDGIQRPYGGAALIPQGNFISHLDFDLRKTLNTAEKECISEIAAEMVTDGDSLFIDASTTCLMFANALIKRNKRNITIITNSPRLVLMLHDESSYRVICTGGTYLPRFDSLVGMPAEEFLRAISADCFFFSVAGISELGCTDSELSEVKIKQLMLNRSRTNILLADHSKFDKYSPFTVLEPAKVGTLITDEYTKTEKLASFRASNIPIIQAKAK